MMASVRAFVRRRDREVLISQPCRTLKEVPYVDKDEDRAARCLDLGSESASLRYRMRGSYIGVGRAGSALETYHRVRSGVLSVSRVGSALPLPAHLYGHCRVSAFAAEHMALQQGVLTCVIARLSDWPQHNKVR